MKLKKLKTEYNNGKDVWESDYRPQKLRIIMNENLHAICKSIQNMMNSEFSILAKGKFTRDGFEITDEYYIPKQTVTFASVDYEENIAVKRREGFNTVIHSHPAQCSDFSENDNETINSHFLCSILLNSSGEPIKGILNLEINGTVFQVETQVDIQKITVNIVGIENINKRESYNYNYQKRNYEKAEDDVYSYYKYLDYW